MSDADAELAEQHARALAELREIGLRAARHLEAQLFASEDVDSSAKASASLHRMMRSVRQTLALEMRLKREAKLQAREDRKAAALQQDTRLLIRKAQVKAAVERLVWTEAEGKEAERLESCLEDLLDEDVLYDEFLEGPVESHIERLSGELGLNPANRRTQPPLSPAKAGVQVSAAEADGTGSEPPEPASAPPIWTPAFAGASGEKDPGAEPAPDLPELRSSA